MTKTKLPPVHILVTPLGSAVDIIEAPLDKWKPEIIYAFTSMMNSVDGVQENLRFAWNQHCGPQGPPAVRTVTIEKPWQTNTIENMMVAFDEMVGKTTDEFAQIGREIEWHVSITGGTNLMAIAMALSASTYLFPVYYTLPGDKHPELRSKPSQLVIDIPLFGQLGPAVRMFRKSITKVALFETINNAKQPLIVERMVKTLDKTPQAVYAQLGPMVDVGIIQKGENHTYTPTTVGRLAYQRWKGSGQS